MTDDESKVQCCKEQYCIGNWNVRSINQDTLEVFKQEMTRVTINILSISELKQTGMGEFNTHDRYIYYCGQESLRRNGVALIVKKRVLGCKLRQRDLCSFPRQTIQHHINASLWPNQKKLNGLLWKRTEIILSFLRLHPSTAFWIFC